MKQKQINKHNLLDEGVALLMRQGYHGTGLKEILDAVNIPKGSFYNYFGSKENFAAEVIVHYITPYLNQLNQYLDESEGNAVAALNRYIEESIAELERTDFKGGCLLGNLMGELSDTSDLCRIALQNALNDYRNVWEEGLRRGQTEKRIRADKSANEMADLWVNAWQGALLRMKIEQSTEPLKQCYSQLLGDFFKA
ncbi:MAG: TetR family transcriptional regulator C-terminal domain-containing protein [Methylococcales bacterium]|jgi:TetR/AcrR family transcriptional repressor of nem operon|nr:TetR family transcriptional regulator C-terminal domain-containing protein [Methylococcales bacterium]